jgi:hypothetical protein
VQAALEGFAAAYGCVGSQIAAAAAAAAARAKSKSKLRRAVRKVVLEKHLHSPVLRSQAPLLEHSAETCATLLAVAESAHAADLGQVRSEQSCCVHAGSVFFGRV